MDGSVSNEIRHLPDASVLSVIIIASISSLFLVQLANKNRFLVLLPDAAVIILIGVILGAFARLLTLSDIDKRFSSGKCYWYCNKYI